MAQALHNGSCLCGQIRFAVSAPLPSLYQCHCSYCRRQSGAGGNAATLVPQMQFQWLSGESAIQCWSDESGFRSDFCGHCGSPVPNEISAGGYWWIPVGLLDETGDARVVADLFVGSRAHWDEAYSNAQFDQMPDSVDALVALLNEQQGK